MDTRDVIRAAAYSLQYAEATTVGDEPLIVDLLLPPKANCHWIVDQLCLVANLTTRAPLASDGTPPLTGLYLLPANVPAETLAQSVAGWYQGARNGLLLPMGPPGGDVATIGAAGPPFPYALVAAKGSPIVVPNNWFLRAIVVCNAGSAAPGPGAASYGRLMALAMQESDDPCRSIP